jgi:serine/threonine protein kinase
MSKLPKKNTAPEAVKNNPDAGSGKKTDKYYDAVSQSSEETTVMLPNEKSEEETTVMLPEEEPEDNSEETTVILPEDRLGRTMALSAQSYEDTTARLLQEKLEHLRAPVPRSYEETTVVLSGGKLESPSGAGPANSKQTIELPGEELERSLDRVPENFTITESERTYYQRAVKRGREREKYRFKGILATGGMGAILHVLEQDLHRLLAMKVLLPGLKNDLETLRSFVKEAKITGFLEHPNIIPIHELGLRQETGMFFTMKLAQGETLKDILTEIKRGNPNYVERYTTYLLLSIFRKVCDAVAFTHSINIIHQDIKPHNIIVGKYGEVFLMDWGLAKILGDPANEHDPVKREFLMDMIEFANREKHHIKGSPSFMSPEQAKGDFSLLDKQSDIFLLGATLYHIFTLEPPYFGNDIYEVLDKAKTRDLIPPEIRSPDRQIPEEICRMIMKAMAYHKDDRYHTVEEFARDIDDLIAGKWSQQEKKVFAPGDLLIRERDIGEEAYLILKGKVQIFKEKDGQRIILRMCKEGDIIGEMSLISQEPRSASVQALEQTEVAILTKELISQHLKKLPPYMEKIVSALTHRLQTTSTLVHPHLTSDCTHVVLKQLCLIFKAKSSTQFQHIAIPLQELVEDISESLGIPEQKVRDVLAKGEEMGLIVNKDESIQISDINTLTQFLNREKEFQ